MLGFPWLSICYIIRNTFGSLCCEAKLKKCVSCYFAKIKSRYLIGLCNICLCVNISNMVINTPVEHSGQFLSWCLLLHFSISWNHSLLNLQTAHQLCTWRQNTGLLSAIRILGNMSNHVCPEVICQCRGLESVWSPLGFSLPWSVTPALLGYCVAATLAGNEESILLVHRGENLKTA